MAGRRGAAAARHFSKKEVASAAAKTRSGRGAVGRDRPRPEAGLEQRYNAAKHVA